MKNTNEASLVKSSSTASFVGITIEPISLDIQHAADFLGTSVRQMRSLVYRRELQPVKLGKKFLFLVEDLRIFIRSKKKAM
jgi:hypothetical protein